MRFVGTPGAEIEGMRRSPSWSSLEALAPTLDYDHNGGAGAPFMHETAQKLSQVMPRAEHRVLEGEPHAVAAGAIATVLAEFFSG
jgi:hypothetical protein